MKRVILAAAVAALSFVGWSADVRDYVQKGLVAQWDGVRNQGAGLAHSADTTRWVDCIGGRTFELENVTVGESYLQFAGSTTSRGVLDAAGTQAVFEKYGPSGTVEYVFLHEGSTSAIILKSSGTSGVALGWTSTTIFSSVSKGPVYNAGSDAYKNKFTSMSVAYFTAAYPRALYVNGVAKPLSGSNNWSENQPQTFIGCRGSGSSQYPFTGKLYAIRVYDHTLTSEEVAQNYAVDVKRFVEGDTSDGSDALVVEGFPEAHGEVSPGYGVTNALVAGNSFVCSAPSEVLGSDEAREAICLGYVLYTRGTGVSDDWVEAGHDSATSFTYVHPESAGSKLVWKWKTALGIKPKLAIVSSAFGKSEVEATVKGIGLTASSATLTFRYGTTPDCADGSVSVTVTDAGEWRATLPHLVGGQFYYVKATLDNLIDTPVESEALPFAQPKYMEHVLPVGYTKVDYVESNGKQFVDTGVNGRDGVEIRSKMEWVSVPSEGAYIGSRGENDTRLYIVYCYKPAWSFGYLDFLTGTVKPSAGVPYDVYVSLAPGDQRIVVDGVTVKEGIDSRSVDTMRPIYLFAYNYNGTPSLYCSAKCYSLQIWDRGVLKRDYMPCYSDAESAYGLYDLVSGTFSKSATATALKAPTVSADERSVCVVSSDATSATLAIAKNASGSTLYRVDGVSYGGEDVAAWGSVADLGTVAASDAPVERTAALNAGWGESVWMTRFFLVTGSTTNWSDTVIWQDTSKPVVDAIAADGIGGDRIVVTGHLASFPGGSCRLYAVVSESEDVLAHPIAGADSGEITVSKAGDFTLTLNDATDTLFVPGSVRYVQVMAVANGKTGASPVAEVRLAGKPVFGAVTASTSRRTITVTGSLTDLGVNPPRTVELWAGDAGALAKVAETTVDTAGKSFTLKYAYPLFEHTYQWQLRVAAETANGSPLNGDPTPATNAKTLDTTTYKWTGNGGDKNWTTRENWDDGNKGDSLGFPQTTAATAQFTKNADVEIDLPRSGTTANIKSLDLGTTGIDVHFHSSDTNRFGLVLGGLTVPGQRSRWTLDHAFVYRAADLSWSAGSTIVLTNSAYFYFNNNTMTAGGVSLILRDESYLSCYAVYLGNGSTNVIADSTFYTRNHDYLGNKAGEALVRFEGTHPLWWHNGKDNYFYSGTATTAMHFDFLVPVEGYDAAPIQCISTQTKLAGNNNTTKGAGSLTVNILDESPLAFERGEHEVPLISWPKAGINTAAFILGNVPHEVPGSALLWSDNTAAPKALSAKIVGYVSAGFVLVKSNDEEFNPEGFDEDSGYGKHEISEGGTLTLTAPTGSVDIGDDWHADIVGWELWSKLDDGSDAMTLVRSSTNNPAAGENTYTCHYTHACYSEFVWLWARTRPLGFGSGLSRASSAVGESDVAVEVSGLGYKVFEGSLTFAYGQTTECSDGTVTVPVDGIGEWRGTIPLLRVGTTYYVKATLTSVAGSATSDVFSFVQPEVAEPGDASSASYQKDGLVGQWDGIDNVIVDGQRMHSDTPDKWYDLSGNGYDGTFASPKTTLDWDDDGWRNTEKTTVPVTVPAAFSARIANKVYTIEFLVEPSQDKVRFNYFSQWNGTKGFGLEQNASGQLRVGYFSSLPVTQDWNSGTPSIPKDEVMHVAVTASNGVHVVYLNGVQAWTATGNANLATGSDIPVAIGGEIANRANMAFLGKWYACRAYDRALSADEVAENYRIDRRRFVEGVRGSQPLELQNGELVATFPASDAERTATLYWGGTYGGTNEWDSTSTPVTIPAGATTVSFSKPTGWGKTVWFARAKIGEGESALWSKTLMAEPPAPLGVEKPTCLSSAFGSSDIAATVTGIGETASSATLTFRYGTTPDCADGAVTVADITDAGVWSATIPRLAAGKTYYVKATLTNDDEDTPVESDVLPVVQPVSLEDGLDPRLRPLPDGYVQMEKLTATGNEYVLIDYWKPDNKTSSETEVGEFTYIGESGIFGQTYAGGNYLMTIQGNVFKWYGDNTGRAVCPDTKVLTDGTKYQIKIDALGTGNGNLAVLNRSTGNAATLENKAIGATSGDFAVFAGNTGSNMARCSLYSFKAWKNGEISIDLVPAYKTLTGEAGLLDLVTGEFRASATMTVFVRQTFVTAAVLTCQGDKLVMTVPESVASGTAVSLFAGATYGGTNGWGAALQTKTIAADEATVEFDLPANWGSSVWFARAKIGEGDDAVWSKTLVAADTTLPSVTLGELDGLGGDTMVVKGTVDSLGGAGCTLKVYTGASEDAITEEWLNLDGYVRMDMGDFTLKLFENDKAASRYLVPGETYFVRVVATSANGKVAWSSVKKVTMAKEAAFKSQSVAVSGHTMTVTASMSGLGMTGATVVQLWVGEDAGSLQMVDSTAVTSVGTGFTLTATLEEFEKDYFWQLKAVNTSEGGTSSTTTETDAATKSTPDTATYTWTGAGTDNRWANRDNWSDNKSGDCLGYPQSVNATAVFNKNADVEIDLPRNGTTANVGSLNLGTADIDVRFHSADTNACGLVLNGLTVPGKRARWTLDHAFVYRAADQTWSAGTTVVLTNAANLYINNCTMSGGDVSIHLLDESRMSVNALYTGGGSTVVVNDSTFETRGNEYLCNAAGESTIRFEGAHPKWRHYRTGNDGLCYVSKDNAANSAHFDFLVPVDGYESVPFETVNVVPNYYMGSASGLSESPNRHITINVLSESPAARVNKEVTTPLVFWGRGIGANVVTGTLPNETGEDGFVWSDKYKGTDTEKFCLLSATIVGSTHDDRLTVTGVPEELVGSSISPGYGNQDVESSRTLTAPAEPTTYDNGTRRATCLGWKLYDVDPATQTAGATPVESGTENTYAWTSPGNWQKFVWQWKREVKVTAEAGTGGSVEPATGWATEDAAYTVTATPSDGYRFYKWTGDVPQQKMFNATLSDIFRKPSALSAVFVSDGELTEVSAAQSGDWSAAETWGGTVPGAGDKVVIDGVTVSVSAADNLLVGAIEVKNGGVLRIWGADSNASKPDPKTVVPLTGIAAGSDLLLDVVGDFTVDGSSWVSVGGRNADYRVFVNVGGDLALGANAKFAVYGGAVEPDPDDVEKYMGDGAAVNVGSNLTTAASAWIYPFAHGVKGSNVRFSVGGDVEIAAGGGFDADGKGYQYPNGPGYFSYNGNGDGGSYGGVGGCGAGESGGARTYGFEYGYAFAPFMVGSSGHTGSAGGSGGGAIRLHVAGDVTLSGTLTADGYVNGDTAKTGSPGCGSGGGIWVTCKNFTPGDSALVSAVGASGNNGTPTNLSGNWRGGGGGGRIAIVTGGVGDALLDELYATGECKDLVVLTTDVNNPAECDYPTLIDIRGGYAYRESCFGGRGTGAIMVNPGDSSILKVTVEPDFNVFEDLALYPVPGSSTLEGTLTATSSTPAFVAGTDRRERRLLTAYDYANAEGTIRTGSTPECELDPADGGSLFLTWKFAQLEKLLRIAYDPTRGSIANLDNEGWYVDGTTATVTAVPAEGWRFLAWTGEVEVEHSGDNPLSLAMDVPHDVEAVFVPSATAETLSATQGGEWFDAATWGGAAVPDENTDVVIDAKTVFLPSVVNVQAKSITVRNGGKLRLWGLGNDLLKITPMVTTCEGTLTATIGGDVTVEGANSWISVGGLSSGYRVDLTIGGNLTLGANGKFAVYGGAVEPDAKDVEKYMGDGAKVTVAGNLTTAAGAWVYPFAHGVKGSNVRFTVGGDVEIAAGGGFDATGRGYLNPNGPGYFYYAGNGDGGSYGGVGGTGAGEGKQMRTYGFAYGYAKAPFMSGSAGNVADGGGTIRIHAQGDFTLAGKLLALPTKPGNSSGSGGGVWITCKNFTPVEGASIEANGLDNNWGWAGGGGGGRVAILTGGCDDGMLAEFYATGESTNENLRVVTTNVNDSAECSYPWLINVRGGKNTGDYQATNPYKPFTNGGDGTGVILLNLGNSRPITVSVEPAAGTMEGLVVSPSVGLTTIEGEVTAAVTATNFVAGTDRRERRILTGHVYANENETLHAGSEASCAVNSADGNELTLAWTFGRLEKLVRVTADANCGTVTGIENGGWYLDGTTATVTAHPAEGWRFLAWTGDVPGRCATENPISLAMDVPRDVKAVFVPTASPAALTATKSGDWFEAETWGGAGVPGADTAVTIESNKNLTVEVTLPMDVSVKSIALAGQGMLRLWGVDATATPNPTTVNPLGADRVDPSFTGELKLTVAESVTIGGKAWMSVGGKGSNYRPQVTVGRDLALDGTAAGFSVYAGPVSTNDLVVYAKGSCRVNVGRSITLANKAIVYPFNHPTNGAAVVFSAQNVTVGTNAAFKAEQAGYNYCYGPGACYAHHLSGKGGEGNGASYGGINSRWHADDNYLEQPTYGNAYAPFWAGSPGTYQKDGGLPGGGAIILEVSRQLTLYGRLDADASADSVNAGLGSGGSVWVKAKRIKIDAGSAKITAKGGSNVWGGAGASGGGRICIVERVPSETQFAEAVGLGDRDDFPQLKGFDVLCTNLTDAATLTAAGFDEAYTNVFSALPGRFSTNSAYYPQSLPTPGTAVWLKARGAGMSIVVR